MTKKNMCQWIDRCFYRHNRINLVDKSICPKRVNNNCEIIPAKPKVRRARAWARLRLCPDGELRVHSVDYTRHDGFLIPVTILIDEKYLKEKRK